MAHCGICFECCKFRNKNLNNYLKTIIILDDLQVLSPDTLIFWVDSKFNEKFQSLYIKLRYEKRILI